MYIYFTINEYMGYILTEKCHTYHYCDKVNAEGPTCLLQYVEAITLHIHSIGIVPRK